MKSISRSTLFGAGLSVIGHAALVLLLAIPRSATPITALRDDAVAVELVEPAPEPVAAPTSPERAPAPPAARAARAAAARFARRAPREVPISVEESPVIAPVFASDETTAEPDEESPEPPPAPRATPDKPAVVAADVARALRVYDSFPSLLENGSTQMQALGVLVRVCVSDRGEVRNAAFTTGAGGQFDSALDHAIRTWRYRPLFVNGEATPFCHFVRIDYRVQ